MTRNFVTSRDNLSREVTFAITTNGEKNLKSFRRALPIVGCASADRSEVKQCRPPCFSPSPLRLARNDAPLELARRSCFFIDSSEARASSTLTSRSKSDDRLHRAAPDELIITAELAWNFAIPSSFPFGGITRTTSGGNSRWLVIFG